MTKRYCDRCGKELCPDDVTKPFAWWTITRHDSILSDITVDLCNKCYNTDAALRRASDDREIYT